MKRAKVLGKVILAACVSISITMPIFSLGVSILGAKVAVAQVTSDAFKKDAFVATNKYNNVNLACSGYAIALYNFVSANQAKYKIASYKVAKFESQGPIVHNDFSPDKPITANGKHYFLNIDGYAFDNHHPTGKALNPFLSGFVTSGKFTITNINISELTTNQQC